MTPPVSADSATGELLPPPDTRPHARLNPLTLAFTAEHAFLERSFRDDYVRHSLTHFRLALPIGALLYASFAILDHLLAPEQAPLLWFARFGVVCPAILGVVALTWRPWFQRIMQPISAALIVLGGSAITWMVLVVPPPARDQYYAGLVLVLIFSYTFIRSRFLWATLTGWIVVGSYICAAAAWTDMSASVLMSNSFFLVSANLAGMATCYAMEYYARRHFYLDWLLDGERANVERANAELERRVLARTAELEDANRLLHGEIAERRRAEEERERLEQQLKQAEKLETIGKLAAGVAHDLNNILVGLVGYPALLLMDLPDQSPLREPILTIQRSGMRAAAIVQDLLSLSRQGVVEKRRLALNRLVDDYLRSPEYRQMQDAHPHVRVEMDLQPDLLDIAGSSVHLTKALMNLVTNAFEANLVAGTVRIATRNQYVDRPIEIYERLGEGDYVVLTVADSGIGIAADDLPRIFEPFFTKKKLGRSGTGLGMTLVWSTVKDHTGSLDLQSTEGVGTTFEIYLPVAREGTVETEPPIAIEDCRGDEHVLVVDDVAEQREIATRMLGKLGYDAVAVSSGEAAVRFLETREADILVLDMIMDPGIDGCETYRRIVERRPGQKAIIVSGYSESDRVREAQRLGAGAYVRKPYTIERLARAVRTELGRLVLPGGDARRA